MKYVSWLWTHSAGIRLNTLVRIVAGIAQVTLGLLMVWLSKQFIDVTIHTGTDADIAAMIAQLVGVVVGAILLRQLYYYLTTKASIHQSNSIRLTVFSQLFHRQLYEEHLHSGDVTSRLSKDIETVAETTTTLLPQTVVLAVQLAGAFLLLYSMDARLAVVLLLTTPMLIVIGKLLARRLRNMTLSIRQQESHIQMQVQEGVEHNAVLRSLGSEQWVTERLDSMQGELVGHVLRRTRFTVVTRLLLAATFSLGYLTAFIWGGLQLRAGVITFGVMTSFLQLVGQIQHPVLNLLNMMPQFFYATASIDRLEELLSSNRTEEKAEAAPTDHLEKPLSSNKTKEEAEAAPTDRQEKPLSSNKTKEEAEAAPTDRQEKPFSSNKTKEEVETVVGIDVSDVSFRYSTGDRLVLDHFSHRFEPRTRTAIMGQTGIGKTTLFRLLLAFIKPTTGTLTLYDAHRRQPVSTATRPLFTFVPQGNTLMSGTVRYNLQLARPQATDDELRQALHTAMADFVSDLPQGLDTMLGERGIGLSEGQAQRIAIARGLLHPASILLLDEISSALDEPTERELFSRLFTSCPDKTIILITHRTEVSRLCDAVVHLNP